MRHVCLLFISIFALYAAYADVNKIKWGYVGNLGPERWGHLNSEYETCSKGKTQSPINIPKKVKNVPASLKLNYHNLSTQQTIVHDEHAVVVNNPDIKQSITFNDKNYQLMNFYTRTPGENQWHNQTFPAEIHFVHQSADGAKLVLAVFVKGGEENPTLQQYIDNVPRENKEQTLQTGMIDITKLLPSKRDYYSFTGSLTTPPCTEELQWIVMAEPITASPSQIVKLRQANGGVNARPVQPLNKRVVNFSVMETTAQ